jgi:hypothetical protein
MRLVITLSEFGPGIVHSLCFSTAVHAAHRDKIRERNVSKKKWNLCQLFKNGNMPASINCGFVEAHPTIPARLLAITWFEVYSSGFRLFKDEGSGLGFGV